jgi:pyruvate/2-oxoglutarate dehydrogenase complex dihydrolipoamide acyltransferase (E2) component
MAYVALKRLKWGDRFIEAGELVPENEPGRNYNALLFSHSIAGEPESATKKAPKKRVEIKKPESAAPALDATEAATTLAEENGVDLTAVTGSGHNGRIVQGDVQAAIDTPTGE